MYQTYFNNLLLQISTKALNKECFALFILVFLCSSLVSEKIGLHAIFGGFIAGLIVPRLDKVTKDLDTKISDFVNTLFVPIYFVSSGFNVDLSSFTSSHNVGTVLHVYWSGIYKQIFRMYDLCQSNRLQLGGI